jgi:hypothetical protein
LPELTSVLEETLRPVIESRAVAQTMIPLSVVLQYIARLRTDARGYRSRVARNGIDLPGRELGDAGYRFVKAALGLGMSWIPVVRKKSYVINVPALRVRS